MAAAWYIRGKKRKKRSRRAAGTAAGAKNDAQRRFEERTRRGGVPQAERFHARR